MKNMLLLICLILTITATTIPCIVGNNSTPPEITIINPFEGYFHFSGIQLFETPLDLLDDIMGFGKFRVRPVQATITDDVDGP